MGLQILILTNRLPWPLNDGGNIATYHVLQHLGGFGHAVTLASLNTRKHYEDPAHLADVAEVYTTNIDTTVNLFGLLRGLFGKIPYNISRFVSADFAALLERILTEKQFDVVQLEGIYLATNLPLIRRFSKAKVVLRAHNAEHKIWERVGKNEYLPHRKLYLAYLAKNIRKFEVEHACQFDGIAAITEDDAAWFRELCPLMPVRAIPAGVHLVNKSEASLQNLPQTVAILGSLEWAPNVQGLEWFLANVWPKVLEKLPAAHLHIAGKNPPEKLLSLKEPNTTMHGTVPNATQFLLKHPVLAVPLQAGGGMRLKVVEAMALGRCIVSTNIGAEGIPAEDKTHLLLADSADDFAAALVTALTNRQLQQQVGENARQLAEEKYAWDGLVRNFEKFYRELL